MLCHVRIRKSGNLSLNIPRENFRRPKRWQRTDLETFVVFFEILRKINEDGEVMKTQISKHETQRDDSAQRNNESFRRYDGGKQASSAGATETPRSLAVRNNNISCQHIVLQ